MSTSHNWESWTSWYSDTVVNLASSFSSPFSISFQNDS